MAELHEPQQAHPIVKRRQILVDKKFQLQFLYIGIFTALGMVAVTVGFYFVALQFVAVEISMWVMRLMAVTGIFILMFTFIMGAISIVLTHRVAGAVFRINGFIQKVLRDDYTDFIKLRKTDYLHNIADSLNALCQRSSKRWRDINALCAKYAELKATLSSASVPPQTATLLGDMDGLVAQLKGDDAKTSAV